jgi:phospholipid/cholesterol/gamma-HCH transport system substrate-binding protein
VELKMFEEFDLYENYEIKIRAESMITGKYVGITPGFPFSENAVFDRVDRTELLTGKESGDVMAMLEDLISDNKDDLRTSIANLRSVSQSFEVTANNLQQITDRINKGEGTVGRLINQDKLYHNTNDLVTELRETIEDTREQAPVTSFIRAALTAF